MGETLAVNEKEVSDQKVKYTRTHRVGSVTTGLSLITFGILFVVHMFTGIMSYEMIFRLWPFMIIGLGVELLISNYLTDKIVYDKAAIFLMIMTSFFAMCMAGADLFFQYFKDGIVF
jgi:hypothetical protein